MAIFATSSAGKLSDLSDLLKQLGYRCNFRSTFKITTCMVLLLLVEETVYHIYICTVLVMKRNDILFAIPIIKNIKTEQNDVHHLNSLLTSTLPGVKCT